MPLYIPLAQAVPFFMVVLFVFPVVLFIKTKQLRKKKVSRVTVIPPTAVCYLHKRHIFSLTAASLCALNRTGNYTQCSLKQHSRDPANLGRCSQHLAPRLKRCWAAHDNPNFSDLPQAPEQSSNCKQPKCPTSDCNHTWRRGKELETAVSATEAEDKNPVLDLQGLLAQLNTRTWDPRDLSISKAALGTSQSAPLTQTFAKPKQIILPKHKVHLLKHFSKQNGGFNSLTQLPRGV